MGEEGGTLATGGSTPPTTKKKREGKTGRPGLVSLSICLSTHDDEVGLAKRRGLRYPTETRKVDSKKKKRKKEKKHLL